MSQVLNAQNIYIALGIIQPANAREVAGFLKVLLSQEEDGPPVETVAKFLLQRQNLGSL